MLDALRRSPTRADGTWFFPEPKVRGASEFEPGVKSICPQGTPLFHFADNEGHNNGRYGLRIFTGRSAHNGEGLPGFYPKTSDPCAPVSATNQFKIARFLRQYSWRNGKNGITVGSVAAVQLIDPLVVDNNMRGIEMTGADGVIVGLDTMTKLRGPWGMNKLIRPVFAGHPLPCPACDHAFRPNFPEKDAPLGWRGRVRLGLVQAAWLGLTVENATFINYDRPGMIAVGGFAKALPPHGAGYDFRNAGSMETRFAGTIWLQSTNRVRWRWNDEALFTDLDGTFTDQPFCAGCHVLQNPLVANPTAFPDCYQDARYGGTICKPNYHIVEAGFIPEDPLMIIKTMRMSHRNTQGDGSGLYVRADDAAYLRDKWRPEGAHNLISMDIATDVMRPRMVGDRDADWFGSWESAQGTWIGPRTASFVYNYKDQYSGLSKIRTQIAEFAADGNSITWLNGTSRLNGSHQLYTHLTWHRCEFVPSKCVGDLRYPDYASYGAPGMNMANTPHFRGSQFHFQLVTGRRYQLDIISAVGTVHTESTSIHLGQAMVAGEWLEIATNPYGAYPKSHLPPGIRPIGALPLDFKLNNIDGASPVARRQYNAADETFAGRRRLMGSSITYDPITTQAIMRFEGPPNCLATRWFDPCGGVAGSFGIDYASPPSPPPPSPPLPPPPPPNPPPNPPPPAAPRAFAAAVTVGIPTVQLQSSGVTAAALTSSVQTRMLEPLSPQERSAASFTPTLLVEGALTLSLSGDVTSAVVQEQVRALAEATLCAGYAAGSCSVAFTSAQAASAGRRLAVAGGGGRQLNAVTSGTMTFAIQRDMLSGGEGVAAPSPPPDLVMLVKPTAGEGKLDPEFSCEGKTGCEGTAEKELTPVYLTSPNPSVLDTASPVAKSFGPTVASALPKTMTPSVVSSEATGIVVRGDLVTLGTDVNNLKSSKDTIKTQLANDLGVSTNAIVVSNIGVYHPPLPPPSPPPSPSSPPMPPLTPPLSPTHPPFDWWYTKYYENEGCDPDCFGGCRRLKWSSPYTWVGQGKNLGLPEDDLPGWPGWKSNVTIKRCTTVVLDADINVQLYSLVVWGTLEIENRPEALVSLRSTCINIKCANPKHTNGCGKLVAGTPSKPYLGRLEFLLSGDELTESHHCGGLKGKFFEVEAGAELALYGNTASTMWGQLRTTARKGDYTLFIQGKMDWLAGDQVIIGTSGPDSQQTEWLTIFATRHIPNPHSMGGWDTEINTVQRLQYNHVGVTEQHGQHQLIMRTEVGLYMRPTKPYGPAFYTIKMAGVDSFHWDFSFKSMKKSLLGLLFVGRRDSKVTMHGVRVEDGGTYKPGLVALREGRKVVPVIRCETNNCDIQRSNICPRKGHGIEAFGGYFAHNIFWQSFVGMRVGGSARVLHNVIYGATDSPGGEPDVSGGGDLDASDSGIQGLDCGRNMVIIGNHIPGAMGPCIAFNGFCMRRAQFQNNTAHSCELGFAVKGSVTQDIQDLTLWQIRHIGIWGYSKSNTPTISNVRVADFATAFFWGNVGGNSEAHVVYQQVCCCTPPPSPLPPPSPTNCCAIGSSSSVSCICSPYASSPTPRRVLRSPLHHTSPCPRGSYNTFP